MTMQKFDLSLWLQDKSRKVVTRDGKPVRIVCWDRKTTYWKIVGLVTSPDGSTENPYTYDVNGNESDSCLHDNKNDLFFADEEKVNSIIDELKSYFEKTPKEQVEKDWKEIQDWYAQHFTNEKHNEKELTEFEKAVRNILVRYISNVDAFQETIKSEAKKLLDLARKELKKEDWINTFKVV